MNSYGPASTMVFVSVPKGILEIGFKKGHYVIVRKPKESEMFFYIDAKGTE